MKYRALLFIGPVAAFVTAAAPAPAENKSALRALFETKLDIDNDGKMDRAVLVSPEDTGFYAPDKDWFMIGADGRVDLYIYLSAGDEKLDVARKPAVLKKDIATWERNNQIFPLASGDNGSLIVKTAYNLYSNWAEETLTIIHRRGDFWVAGFSYSFERRSGEQGDCDINFLSGKGVASKELAGKKKSVKAKFSPVKLADWSEKKYPMACKF